MSSMERNVHDLCVVCSFINKICNEHKFKILNRFEMQNEGDDKSVRVTYITEDGILSIRTYHKGINKLILDFFIERVGCEKQIQDIKQQALLYFAPRLYRVYIKPRGSAHSGP